MLNLLRAVFRMVRLRLVFRRRGGGICYVGIPVSAIHMAHDPLGQFPRRGTTIKAYHTHCLYNGLVDRRASAQPPLSAGARNNLRLLQKPVNCPSWKSVVALLLSFIAVAIILVGMMNGVLTWASDFELFAVNTLACHSFREWLHTPSPRSYQWLSPLYPFPIAVA